MIRQSHECMASTEVVVEFHPFASIFPLLEGGELQDLAADIREHGLHEPITTFEGKILDGRNRQTACLLAKVIPSYEPFAGTRQQALHFVWSENRYRRHLTSSQMAACTHDFEQQNKALVAELRRDAEQRKKSGRGADGSGGRGKKKNPVQTIGHGIRDHSGDADAKLAAKSGTNRQYVADVRKIASMAPDQVELIKSGKKTVNEVKREIQRSQKRAELETAADAVSGKPVDWRIINDDCMNSLGELEDGIASLVFADPPYNIGIDYGLGASADSLSDGDYMRWVDEWLNECNRILSPTGTLWVMIGDEYADRYGVTLRDIGLHRRAWVKWYETFGVNCQNNFNRCSRHLFYCIKNAKRFTFNREPVTRPSDRQTKYSDKRADSAGKIWDDVWQIPRLVGTAEERLPDFPTQVPLKITQAIVGCCSMPGELVVDPFSGSSSTGAACIELGRRYIGIEKNEQYVKLSQKRLMVVQDEVRRTQASGGDKRTRNAG